MVAVAVTAILLAALAWSRLPATTTSWIDVVALDELRRAGVVHVADEEVFVVAEGEGVVAFQADAQHIPNELVSFCRCSGWFEGLHGEMFDHFGRYALGPARSGLTRVASRIDGDTVQIDPSIVLDTPARDEPHTEPNGPFCQRPEEPQPVET